MATLMTSCDDETEKRVVVKAAQPKNSAARPMQSDFYIVARAYDADFTLTVYPLSTVPFDVFFAWLDDILEARRQQCFVLSVIVRDFDAWQSVKFLDSKGIDMSKYLFTRREDAEQALAAMKSRREGAESEAGNGEK